MLSGTAVATPLRKTRAITPQSTDEEPLYPSAAVDVKQRIDKLELTISRMKDYMDVRSSLSELCGLTTSHPKTIQELKQVRTDLCLIQNLLWRNENWNFWRKTLQKCEANWKN